MQVLGIFLSLLSLAGGAVSAPGGSNEATAIWHNDQGNIALKSGNLLRALDHYQNAYARLSNHASIQSNILSTLVRLGRPFDAVNKAVEFGLLNESGLVGDYIVRTQKDQKRLQKKRRELGKTEGDLSVYGVIGVALHNIHRLDMAVLSFRQALFENEKDGVTWVNLGETLLHQRRAGSAIWAFENALLVHRVSDDFSPLLKARSWLCDWRDRGVLEAIVQESFRNSTKRIRATGDFINVKASEMLKQSKLLWPKSRETPRLIASGVRSVLRKRWSRTASAPPPRLRVGLLSADFGVHPVSSLIRGVVGFFNTSRIDCYLLIWTEEQSWWRKNITAVAENVVDLFGLSVEAAARKVQSLGVDVLIDLSGLTLHSGLEILGLRPAPLQLSFLGFPMSTGTSFVDYFVTDSNALDPAVSKEDFSEHLLFTPSSFFANDYAQVQSHVIWRSSPSRDNVFGSGSGVTAETVVFACFSNFGKIDPGIFDVWANILRRVPRGVLWMLRHPDHEEASENLKQELSARGISPNKLLFTDMQPWIHHILTKSVADLVLDTTLKNGHTSTADAIWAGVPVLTLCGKRMSTRIATSIVAGNDGGKFTVVHSLQEYENFAVSYAQNRYVSRSFDSEIEQNRLEKDLFNTEAWTKTFEIQLQALHDIHAGNSRGRMHFYGGPLCPQEGARPGSFLVSSTRCEKGRKLTLYGMPHDEFTEHFYSSSNTSDLNASIRVESWEDIRPANDGPANALLFLYVGGKSNYEAWTTVSHSLVNSLQGSVATALYVSPSLGDDRGLSNSNLANYARVLRPGGMLFCTVVVSDSEENSGLFPQSLVSFTSRLKANGFCNVAVKEEQRNERFDLFVEDETAFLQQLPEGSKVVFYVRARRCILEGDEQRSVAVEIAGKAIMLRL
jgi:predicted O-linked N-acetylglucosamine transferase (SPINDLY family)